LTEDWREEKGIDVSNWESKSLGELVLESANGFSKRRSDNGKETVVLRLADFKNAERFVGNERTVKMDEKELKKYGMVNGDLLIIRVNGSRDLAGRFIEYKNTGETLEAYCDHFIRLRLDTTKILSRFASFVANSGEGRRYIELELVTSAGQNTINQPSVFGLMIDVPSLEEQAEIVRRVEKLFAYAERLEARYTSASEHVERLTPSLLAKAFRGELVRQE
jgi:type I restriction enzyme S subunit